MTSGKKVIPQRIPVKSQKCATFFSSLQSLNPDAGQQIHRTAHKAGVVQPDKQELREYKGMDIWEAKTAWKKNNHHLTLHNIMLSLMKKHKAAQMQHSFTAYRR